MMATFSRFFFTSLFALWMAAATAQNPVKPESAKRDPIELLSPKGVDVSQPGSVIFNHTGNVKLRHHGALLFCDQAIQRVTTNQVQSVGHVLIVQGDTIIIKADTLNYDGNNRRAVLRGRVVFQDRRIILNVSQLDYDLLSGVAHYTNRGRLVDGRNVLTSREGYYDSRSRQIEMKQGVRLVSPENTLTSEFLIYNTVNRMVTLLAPTRISGKEGVSIARQGQYDTQNAVVQPSTTTETAKYITLSESADRATAPETVVAKRTTTTPAQIDENLVASQTSHPIVAGESVAPVYKEAEKKVEKPIVQPAPVGTAVTMVDSKSTSATLVAVKPAEAVSIATTGNIIPAKPVVPAAPKATAKPVLKRPAPAGKPIIPAEEPVSVAAVMVPTPKPDEQVFIAVTAPKKVDAAAENTNTAKKIAPAVAPPVVAAKKVVPPVAPPVVDPQPATSVAVVAPAVTLQPAAALPTATVPVATASAPPAVAPQPARVPVLQVAVTATAKRTVKPTASAAQVNSDAEVSDLERELNRKKRTH